MRRWITDPMRGLTLIVLASTSALTACGYSRQEWEQQLRENAATKTRLDAESRDRHGCEEHLTAVKQDGETLKEQLRERGVDVEHLSTTARLSKLALEEYQLRLEQLEQYRAAHAALRKGLVESAERGVTVQIRNNRLVVVVPAALLFNGAESQLTKDGEKLLQQISQVISADSNLVGRSYQVGAHFDGPMPKGSPVKDALTLSALQAKTIVAWMTAPAEAPGGGLDAARWSAVAYGASRPSVVAEGGKGSPKNQRVELVMQPESDEMLDLDALQR